MRVLFAVAGPSRVLPLVPLAWAFRTAGHEVLLAGSARATETMLHSGLPGVTLGSGPKLSPQEREELVATAYGQHPWAADWPVRSLDAGQVRLLEMLGRYTVAVAEGMADELVAFADRWRPELIVHDTLALCARVAGTLLDVPCVRYTHGTQDVFRMEYRILDGEPLPEYTALFERFGLDPPVDDPSSVDTMPPGMFIGGERPSMPMRWVPQDGPGAAPDGLTGFRRRPRICVTSGLAVANTLGSGTDLLVLTGAEAPLNLVLPHCDALVHHGGENGGMAAAALGVPQLVITREPLDDQFGGRLANTGAAIQLRQQHLARDPGQLMDAMEKLLWDPGYAAAAARLRDDIERQPSPADVVPHLVALPVTRPPARRPAPVPAPRRGRAPCRPGSRGSS